MSTSRELVRVSSLGDDTPVIIQTGRRSLALTINDARQWLPNAETAPSSEVMKFLMICQARGVDPFLGEAHFFEMGGKWTTIVDISGWIEVAERHPSYDGHECGLVIQQVIEPARPAKPATKASPAVPATPAVMGEIRNIDGCIKPDGWHAIGGWCRVYRKDRQVPTYRAVSMLEYNRDNRQWKALPFTMIVKVAVVQALAASGIVARSGGYIREELPERQLEHHEGQEDQEEQREPGDPGDTIDVEIEEVAIAQLPKDDEGVSEDAGEADAETPTESATESPACTPDVYLQPPQPGLSPEIARELMEELGRSGMTDYEIDCMLARRGVSEINELDDIDARGIISKLRFKWDQDHAGEILLPDPQPEGEPTGKATQEDEDSKAAESSALSVTHDGDIVTEDGEVIGSVREGGFIDLRSPSNADGYRDELTGDTITPDDRAGDREIRDREIVAAYDMFNQANSKGDIQTAAGIAQSIAEAYGEEAIAGWYIATDSIMPPVTDPTASPADDFEIGDAPRREERVEPVKAPRKRAKKA